MCFVTLSLASLVRFGYHYAIIMPTVLFIMRRELVIFIGFNGLRILLLGLLWILFLIEIEQLTRSSFALNKLENVDFGEERAERIKMILRWCRSVSSWKMRLTILGRYRACFLLPTRDTRSFNEPVVRDSPTPFWENAFFLCACFMEIAFCVKK